jgi:hypothetical protein
VTLFSNLQKEKTMATPNAYSFLRSRLATLAFAQRKAKRARKRLPEAELAVLRRELTGSDNLEWCPQRDVVERRVEITACLNLYHEIRGSAHRHGIQKGCEWRHDSVLKGLRQELATIG